MTLLTKQLVKRFNQIGKQTNDPLVIAKLFNPCGSQTWYVTEYDQESNIIFCYVTGMFVDEWGYTSLAELQALRHPPFGLPIERDRFFTEKRFSKLNL